MECEPREAKADLKLEVITIDGRRGTGKTELAINICRVYGSSLLEIGPLFRLVAWRMQTRNIQAPSQAVNEVSDLLQGGDLTIGPLNKSSPCGLGISMKGVSLVNVLWSHELDSRLKLLAGSRENVNLMRGLVNHFVHGLRLVVVGREAGSEFFPNAELKLLLSSHDHVRTLRKRSQLMKLASHERNREIDAPEPAHVDALHADCVVIDTSELSRSKVFQIAQAEIEKHLRWLPVS